MKRNIRFYKDCLDEVAQAVRRTPKTVVDQRRLSQCTYSFARMPFDRQILIWDFIWKHADNGWLKIQAYYYCERFARKPEELVSSWKTIHAWQEQVADWGTCDALAKLYTKLLELMPEQVLPVLRRWNRSANPWKRRQSVVSLLYFSRTKRRFLPFTTIIGFIDRLLAVEEYYVQKGVGWSLKELSTVYPGPTFNYLQRLVKKISPAAFSPAIEKLSVSQKRELKRLRALPGRKTVQDHDSHAKKPVDKSGI